jgi:hypothetical protein
MISMSRLPLRAAGTWIAFGALTVAFISGTGATAFGQASAVRAGSVEVGPFIGASYGLDAFHVMGGGNITYALKNKYVLPYFEYSYFPGLPRTNVPVANTSPAQTINYYSMSLSDFHGGVHIRLPIKESRFVPYLVFGVGGLHNGEQDNVNVTIATTPNPTPAKTDIPGGTNFAINGGGGIRYYIGGSGTFGLRAEAKIYHATSGPFEGVNFGKVELGFFFQLH